MKKLYLFFIVSMLGGCSSICIVSGGAGTADVTVGGFQELGKENTKKLQSCVKKTSYNYSQGSILSDFIPSGINTLPSCLLRKAKNDAFIDGLVVIERSYFHFEAGLQYNVSTYKCPINIEFTEAIPYRVSE
ncbi:MAG: hypothetical protein GY787_11295 [Alteromonadales bacterium]|nr:hypothetical protein [Alteromonadales bacterium]